MDASQQQTVSAVKFHSGKIASYLERKVKNSALGVMALTIVFKELIAHIREVNGDELAQNVVQGFLQEFQAGGWIPITGNEVLKMVNDRSAGVIYQSTGIVTPGDGKAVMDNAIYVECKDDAIQTFAHVIRLPCWYHPALHLPDKEIPGGEPNVTPLSIVD